ncbi:hypothetical protein Pan44_26640 [Caulifigura coniformis]|uniref:Uncharacterized protein n=1 Tax=Caulifigura coniformis TaxID=2527983 RepID=A0A517SET3_9PLAN|nr:hypothetical protein [Caulifigura coniformis]QDT54629.1 hypothetical protein Pan44_26640 [Caulifigura coniformis]
MSDPYRLPVSGEAFEPTARQIATWNQSALSAARGGPPPSPAQQGLQRHLVLVKNTTGSPVPRLGVLKVTEPVIDPAENLREFLARVIVKAAAPNSSSPAFVAQETIPAGGMGYCLAPGIVSQAKLSVPDGGTYKYARPLSTSKFEAIAEENIGDDDFVVHVLWHKAGAGDQWALLLLTEASLGAASAGAEGACGCGGCVPRDGANVEVDTDTDGYKAFGRYAFDERLLSYDGFVSSAHQWSSAAFSIETDATGPTSIDVYYQMRASGIESSEVEIKLHRNSDDAEIVNFRRVVSLWKPHCGAKFFPQTQSIKFRDWAPPCEVCLSPLSAQGCDCNGSKWLPRVTIPNDVGNPTDQSVGNCMEQFCTQAVGEHLLLPYNEDVEDYLVPSPHDECGIFYKDFVAPSETYCGGNFVNKLRLLLSFKTNAGPPETLSVSLAWFPLCSSGDRLAEAPYPGLPCYGANWSRTLNPGPEDSWCSLESITLPRYILNPDPTHPSMKVVCTGTAGVIIVPVELP